MWGLALRRTRSKEFEPSREILHPLRHIAFAGPCSSTMRSEILKGYKMTFCSLLDSSKDAAGHASVEHRDTVADALPDAITGRN